MGIKRFEVYFLTLFSLDHKVCLIINFLYIFSRKDVGRKNISAHIFSEGRRQEKYPLKAVRRMSQSVIGTTPPGGLGGAGAPPMCRPPSYLVKLK